ncbi:anaerobic magnesium-protoporphyrin IX monomethyl ester cyclase [Roseivirga ehrenbergii]|uniref:Radical SAM protein n=1 Tax=Roseivirga ehrenbergii (strain DSM 102268 / JCM 13514 / KCTC 12282 / NCIMB 14502 / KMM 6017) TaxID=279360 RepID=A0A150XN32_ROSEK|nr:radical SAM protein [Roseivirga ehrenbergii]KYG80140.1 radical SAM protein [Roseivirga ehrenbergii]TCK99169.1 anaerobic magnesium-protoporphyrin IX monomethyl ester cyclase [Roseivirga ehrenbergii]
MGRVLVTNTYFYPLDAKQWHFKKPYPPLGTIQISSLLKKEGHVVRFFDNCLNDDPRKINGVIEELKPDYLLIYDDGFNYLTKMCLTAMRDAAYTMAGLGQVAKAKVIISSSDSSDRFDQYLQNGVDYVVMGEGDTTVVELLSKLDQELDPNEILGLAHLGSDGQVNKTVKRAVLQKLDDLPLAAWDLVDMEAYRKIWTTNHGYFSINIATTRGCPYKCNWCAKPIYGNRYNSRSPEHVIQEIKILTQDYGVNHFWMCDDIFGLTPSWVQQFNMLVKENNLNFKYMIQSRVDLLLKEDTIDVLVESGLETIWLGAESGSQHILDAMDKGITVEQIYEAVPKLQRRGVSVALFLQFGYLGETLEDIYRTIDMVQEIMPEEIGISVSYPLPGTKFYEKVKDDLQVKANWVDSDDLDLMFTNKYSPSFYKKLHRYVHNRHKLKRGLLALKQGVKSPSSINNKKLRQILTIGYHLPMALVNGAQLKIQAKKTV